MNMISKALILGDAMIPGTTFEEHFPAYLGELVKEYRVDDWEPDWDKLQYRRLEVEKQGPEIEEVPALVQKEGSDAEMVLGLFVPVSSKLMEAMPGLRIAGVCRAGLENVNIEEANSRGILVFNVKGRNAEAVSDYAVGLMLAESRNIARAHFSIKNGKWRKTFSNSDHVPQMKGKTIGIIGFGYIGQLVARKLSGFNVQVLVYDPYVESDAVTEAGARPVDKAELFSRSDFVTVHARLSEESRGMIGRKELESMKPTSYLINTGRAGLIDHDALLEVLKEKKIAGAGLDVFPTEPLPQESGFIQLDNVTLTTHIAGTTEEALTNSPALLMEDIGKFLKGEKPRFIVNEEVLQNSGFMKWFKTIQQK